ncbi:sortase domain-containing protein [Pseudoalteromonas sp. G4]|uniref:sortase domain-containing protein n=1 Tax=Pseudoalteromonas sp. G4 TaxID=2992761 RepID=UPI00237E78A6|nr:sortase [Pseudoalteromonas sp. G4]MDE3272196.1 sortase [Pseudoalteromonas sp. G4]
MKSRRKLLRLLALCIAMLGLVLVFKSSYVYGKAQLAQFLLWQAWQENKIDANHKQKAWYYADGYPVGELIVESKSISQIVLNEASNRNLAFAPGIWHHSSNNILVAAHNDTHFSFVKDVKVGEKISYQAQGKVQQHFKVVNKMHVDYRDSNWLLGLEGYLVLITCERRNGLDLVPEGRVVVVAEPVI